MTQPFAYGMKAVTSEIKQNATDDLIYDLSRIPNWLTVPYIKDGLYDRLQHNFKQYKNEDLLIDQEEYQWFRRPATIQTNFHITSRVRLLKSTAPPNFLYKHNKDYSETVDLVIYDSAVNAFISAVTWTTTTNIIKPMKILKHAWEHEEKGIYKCETCGMMGQGKFFTSNHMRVKSAICPNQLLTCEEKIVQDIVV